MKAAGPAGVYERAFQMLTRMPGSVALYAPGNETRFDGVLAPEPPVTLIWAHEM